MSSDSGKRCPVYDQAKGIAIILVVAGHLISQETWLSKWIYSFHIPLFLFVNGCLQAQKEPVLSLTEYARKETRTLLYPFLVFSLLKSVINFFVEHGSPEEYADPVIWLFLFAGDGALWYLPAFFVSAILFYWFRKRGLLRYYVIPFLCTFLLAAVISRGKPFEPIQLLFYLNLVCRSLIMCTFTIAGYCFARHFHPVPHQKGMALMLLAGAALLSQVNDQPDIHYSSLGNPILFYAVAGVSCMGILMLLKGIDTPAAKPGLLSWLGKNSLIIFLTHTTFHFTGLCRDFMELWTSQPLAVTLGATILVLLLEVPVIWLMNGPLSFLIRLPRKRRVSQ